MRYRFKPTEAFWESDCVVTVDVGTHDLYNG
jgi:hypothetical protein